MILGLIICFAYVLSMIICGAIFIERDVQPNPISILIVICPMINTIYCICRIASLNGHWNNWTENL